MNTNLIYNEQSFERPRKLQEYKVPRIQNAEDVEIFMHSLLKRGAPIKSVKTRNTDTFQLIQYFFEPIVA